MKRYSTTETAKEIRAALAKAFPAVLFSVRSKKYSGGSSIRISWQDGPRTEQVEEISKRFAGAGFDGMQDLKYFLPASDYKGEHAEFSVDFVFTSRSISFEAMRAAALRVAQECDLPLAIVSFCEHGHAYVKDADAGQRVPFRYSSADDVIASDPHGGEWYAQLVHQVARNMSFTVALQIEGLPKRLTQEYIDSAVSSYEEAL